LMSTQPGMMKTAVVGLLGLMLVLLVLKPVAGQMVTVMKEPLMLPGSSGSSMREETSSRGGGRKAELESSGGAQSWSELSAAQEDQGPSMFDEVTGHIKRDPSHSTRLIEAWIAADGDE